VAGEKGESDEKSDINLRRSSCTDGRSAACIRPASAASADGWPADGRWPIPAPPMGGGSAGLPMPGGPPSLPTTPGPAGNLSGNIAAPGPAGNIAAGPLNSGNVNAARNTLNYGNVNVDRGGGGSPGSGYYGDRYYGGYGRGPYFWGGYAAGAATGAAAASNNKTSFPSYYQCWDAYYRRYYTSSVQCPDSTR